MSGKWTALDHQINVIQRYGPIVRAAGIDPDKLDSMTIFELSGYIENDREVQRLFFAAAGDNQSLTNLSLAQWNELLLDVIRSMNPASRRAMAERALAKL